MLNTTAALLVAVAVLSVVFLVVFICSFPCLCMQTAPAQTFKYAEVSRKAEEGQRNYGFTNGKNGAYTCMLNR